MERITVSISTLVGGSAKSGVPLRGWKLRALLEVVAGFTRCNGMSISATQVRRGSELIRIRDIYLSTHAKFGLSLDRPELLAIFTLFNGIPHSQLPRPFVEPTTVLKREEI